ncbi:MAG: Spx/MgsR family RNA polymerase-binding regulatory protein [Candidatus Sericytochromatia bacterium]
MTLKFFGYNKCSTCIKAKKFLISNNVVFEDLDIISNPPSVEILKEFLNSGEYKLTDLFNKSGEMYRELNMKEKINVLSEEELLDLLSKNGKLVKRPLLTDGKTFAVGFKEEVWNSKLVK